jgi:hypothetical protein
MIRRGLQIVFAVGIVALGAAPSFGQLYQHFPESVTVSGFPVSPQGNSLNGFFALSGYVPGSGGEYTMYGSDPVRLYIQYFHNGYVRISIGAMSGSSVFYQKQIYVDSSAMPATISGFNQLNGATVTLDGQVILHMDLSDPYEINFPDWESAGTKIPLGFGMGMAFWAAALALIIPIKWAKDLASAAS